MNNDAADYNQEWDMAIDDKRLAEITQSQLDAQYGNNTQDMWRRYAKDVRELLADRQMMADRLANVSNERAIVGMFLDDLAKELGIESWTLVDLLKEVRELKDFRLTRLDKELVGKNPPASTVVGKLLHEVRKSNVDEDEVDEPLPGVSR